MVVILTYPNDTWVESTTEWYLTYYPPWNSQQFAPENGEYATRNAFPDSQTRTLDLLFMGSLDLFWKELSGWKWPSQVAQKDQQKSGNLWGKTSAFSGLLGWQFFHKSKHDEQSGSQQRWRGGLHQAVVLLVLVLISPQKEKPETLGWCSLFLVTVTTKGWV